MQFDPDPEGKQTSGPCLRAVACVRACRHNLRVIPERRHRIGLFRKKYFVGIFTVFFFVVPFFACLEVVDFRHYFKMKTMIPCPHFSFELDLSFFPDF